MKANYQVVKSSIQANLRANWIRPNDSHNIYYVKLNIRMYSYKE